MDKWIVVCALVVAVGMVGCRSEGVRVDADKEVVKVQGFNPKDMQLITDKMVDSLAGHYVLNDPRSPMPPVYINQIKNRTDEHIDTQAITKRISTRLIKTNRVRYLAMTDGVQEAIKQLDWQHGKFVDPATAQRVGKMLGARYFLMGDLTNIKTGSGRTKSNYFLFTLTLVDIETLVVPWQEEKEIQKIAKRGVFGW